MDARQQSSSSARPLSIENVSRNAPLPSPLPNQPRQPTNLQGLLKYAMNAKSSEDTRNRPQASSLDEESKKFLTNALSSLTVNVIKELETTIQILRNVENVPYDNDSIEHENALEKISHYVDNIDTANDFYKIGGFTVLKPCLNSPHSNVRWKAANVIAELAQNNPFCQEKMLEAKFLPILLSMVDTDPSEQARIKALYAISCIVRENPESLKYMNTHDGYSVLLRAMQSSVEKLQIKSAFLLSNLCNKEDSTDIKYTLLEMGFIEQVTGLLSRNDVQPAVREQLLRMLYAMTKFPPALEKCCRPQYCLKAVLEELLSTLGESPENQDELNICSEMLEKISKL